MDKAVVTVIENILDQDMIAYCKNKTIELDYHFKSFDTPLWYHKKLGSATEFREASIRDTYLIEAQKFNPLLWKHFKPIYNHIAKKLSEYTNIECVYDQRFFLPGIRTFVPKQLGILNKELYHYDRNIYVIDWKNLIGKEIINTISVTVIIEVPDYSHFYYLKGSETNDPLIFNQNFSRNIEKLEPFLSGKTIIDCKEGNATFQWNHILHSMGPMKVSNLNQRRTTMQISGVHDGEKIWLNW
jgi:hypothetical protein